MGIIFGLLGILFSTIFLYDVSFPSGLIAVFFTTMIAIPYMYYLIIKEEKEELKTIGELTLLKHHINPLKNISLVFLGITTAYLIFNLLLPEEYANLLFQSQYNSLEAVKQLTTGFAIKPAEIFTTILQNNLRVLILTFLTSLAFGAGAIFILSWNASIIGIALADYSTFTFQSLTSAGANTTQAIFGVTYKLLLGYGIHGSLEILAYIIMALTGGILSAYITNHHYNKKRTNQVIIEDLSALIFISLTLLILGAFVEAFISPLIL